MWLLQQMKWLRSNFSRGKNWKNVLTLAAVVRSGWELILRLKGHLDWFEHRKLPPPPSSVTKCWRGKSCPNVSTSCLKISTAVFTLIYLCQNSTKVNNLSWDSFVANWLPKNFLKIAQSGHTAYVRQSIDIIRRRRLTQICEGYENRSNHWSLLSDQTIDKIVTERERKRENCAELKNSLLTNFWMENVSKVPLLYSSTRWKMVSPHFCEEKWWLIIVPSDRDREVPTQAH